MNNILKYLSAAAQAKLQASPTILARIPTDIARIEAEALAEAKAEFAIIEKAELEKKQQEAKIKAEQEARSKEAYIKEVDKKHSVINEQHKGNYGEVVLEDKKQNKIYPIAKQTEPTDLFSKVKEEEAKKASIISNQRIEAEKRLAAEIAETDKLNSSQFSNGIKVNSEIQFDTDRKIYPISTKTTPQDTFSLFEGKSSPFEPKVQQKQELKVSLGSNSVSQNYDPYGQSKGTNYSVPSSEPKVQQKQELKVSLGSNSVSNNYDPYGQVKNTAYSVPKTAEYKEKARTYTPYKSNTYLGKKEQAGAVKSFGKGVTEGSKESLLFDFNFGFENIFSNPIEETEEISAKKLTSSLFTKNVIEQPYPYDDTPIKLVLGQRVIEGLPNFSKTKEEPIALSSNKNALTQSISKVTEEDFKHSKLTIEKKQKNTQKKNKSTNNLTVSAEEQSVVPEEIKAKLEIDAASKLTTPVVPQETTPSSIVEELKPQEPQVLEDKKVAKLSPEPVKPEGQEIPKEPSVNLEEEQKAKLLQEEEAKKLAETKAKEEERVSQEELKQKEKNRLEEERLAEIADNEAKIKASEAAKSNLPKESELPKITSEPKVADAQKVEPKIRVIPPKDIKPIQADSLVSFDTETTGIDTKKSRIWQVGSATNLGEGKDYHLNPFDNKPKNSKSFFEELKKANGIFSEKAAAAGNFKGALVDFRANKLVSLEQGLLETIGKFDNESVAVLQNANFENRLIQAAVDRGEVNKETLNTLSEKFMHASIDKQGRLTGALFNSSSKVKEAMREAEFTFRTKFMPSRSEESFKTYTDLLNTAYKQYGEDITSAKAAGKIASVELMDISKIFYANLAERNLISKNSVQLGLNIEFLASTLLGEPEKHLASSDSSQTIRLFQRLNTHIGDMLSGNITDELKADAAKIRESQPAEVNKKFLSTLNSRLEDLERRSYTYQTNSAFSFYSPESIQKNMATGEIETVEGIALNSEKMKLTTMEDVIQDTFRSYEHYSDNLEGFNRAAYATKLQEDIGKGSKLGDIISIVQNTTPEVEGPTLPFNYETDFEAKGQGLQKAARDISGDTIFLGKQMKKSTAGAILAGTAATLGVMAMTDNPNKNEIDQNAPVFENFYDEQYLGTAFVEFRDRNKRYVY